jgi:hypothetical protein
MKITEKDLIGKIEGFPIEIVKKMIERQVEAGNPANVEVFQRRSDAVTLYGGFTWVKTPEGHDFWEDIICEHNFDLFFKKYPKKTNKVYIYQDGTIPGDLVISTLEEHGGVNSSNLYGNAGGPVIYFIEPKNNEICSTPADRIMANLVTEFYTKLEIKKPKNKISKQKVYECLSFLTGEPEDSWEIVD